MEKKSSFNHEVMSMHTLDALTETVLWVDKNARFFYVNKAATQNLGYSFEELMNMRVHDIDPLYPKENWKENFNNFLAGKGLTFTSINVNKDGVEFPVFVKVSVIEFENEKYLCAIVRDISEEKRTTEALFESNEKFESIFMSSPLPISIITYPDVIYVEVNPALEQISGYNRSELIGKSMFDVNMYADEKYYQLSLDQLQKDGRLRNFEIPFRTKSGEIRICNVNSEFIIIKGNIHILSIVTDITEQRVNEKALKESEENFRSLTENARDGIFISSANTKILYANKSAETITGYTLKEFNKLKFQNFFTPEQLKIVMERVESHLKGIPSPSGIELDFRKKDGSWAPFEMVGSKTIWQGEPAIMVIFRDISERKWMEKEREQYQNALKNLASELVLTEEREKKRIAEDLHDNMSQSLAMSKIILNNLKQACEDEKTKGQMGEAVKLLDSAIDQSRSLTYELSPPVLYEFGLIPAIKWNLERVTKMHNIKGTFRVGEEESRLNTDSEILLYRAVNELFNNVVKHAGAGRITVDIKTSKDYLYISVADDGAGFEETEADRRQDGSHKFGLFSIRERVESMQGKMEIHSGRSKGTSIDLSIPIS